MLGAGAAQAVSNPALDDSNETAAPRTMAMAPRASFSCAMPTNPTTPTIRIYRPPGSSRAEKLANYIPQTFGKPDFIIATARSKHSDRPAETVSPLAKALGVRVQHDIKDKDFEELVDELFSNPDYLGKIVVVCWHHGTLPDIAAMLGAPAGTYPDPWPDETFNVILDFRYDPGSGNPPAVTLVTEPF